MAPYPDDVDVFSTPHLRMKQLVEDYSSKLIHTDFSNLEAMKTLLRILEDSFREFKSHENIENEYIMGKLKERLHDLHVFDHESAVCNCHSDNRLSEMLQLVRDGYDYYNGADGSYSERLSYGQKLESALHEFRETFLPHMEEEETVFQPMLIKYFKYDELKLLKERVIEQHERVKTDLENASDVDGSQTEKFSLDEVACDSYEHADSAADDESGPKNLLRLPPEVTVKVFSFLRTADLGVCAKVCKAWRSLVRHPNLWRSALPAQWARGIWDSTEVTYYPEDDRFRGGTLCKYGSCSSRCDDRLKCSNFRGYNGALDEDADIDESCQSSGEEDDNDVEFYSDDRLMQLGEQRRVMKGFAEWQLPEIGPFVRHLSFAGSSILNGNWLSCYITACPNLNRLNFSYTNLNDESIEIMKFNLSGCIRQETSEGSKYVGCDSIQHLDLSGCYSVSDTGFKNLISCLFRPVKSGSKFSCNLQSLLLSGCGRLTDDSLRFLISTPIMKSLRCVDLSGCYSLSGDALNDFVDSCPKLEPERFSYCDLIMDGPCQDTANGCQNLESRFRFCCRSGD